MQVQENNTVKVHYTGKLTDGQIFDSSLEREPLQFTIGQGMIIPGFENGIVGMVVGEKKTINIPVAEAYGEVRSEMLFEVPKAELPQDIEPQVGMTLMSVSPEGQEFPLTIVDVKPETIVVDGNHPLAGKDLVFEVELIEIV